MKKLIILFLFILFIPTNAAASSNLADKIIDTAKQYIGTPYQFGAPLGNTSSFDCSSFSATVFGAHGIMLPRMSSDQARIGEHVTRANIRKGDLLFYDTNFDGQINHLAIYINEQEMIHASSSRGVHITAPFTPYWEQRFVTARKVIPTFQTKQDAISHHMVQPGDSLFLISRKYNITIEQLKQWNNLMSDTIFVGQSLVVQNKSTSTHTVQAGESLWIISQKYQITISQLQAWNSLSTTTIFTGQVLVVENPAKVTMQSTKKTYTVKSGDTLWLIANAHKMTVDKLIQINNLTSSTIFPGQILLIE